MISVVRLRYGGGFRILRSIFMMLIVDDSVWWCSRPSRGGGEEKEGKKHLKDVLTLSMCAWTFSLFDRSATNVTKKFRHLFGQTSMDDWCEFVERWIKGPSDVFFMDVVRQISIFAEAVQVFLETTRKSHPRNHFRPSQPKKNYSTPVRTLLRHFLKFKICITFLLV